MRSVAKWIRPFRCEGAHAPPHRSRQGPWTEPKIRVWRGLTGLLCVILSGVAALAGPLAFPDGEEAIVRGLSFKNGRSVHAGIEYVLEHGKVYRMINGQRYRVRGLEVIETLAILPRVGALIHFAFDSSHIDARSYPLLDEYGKALKGELAGSVIMIAGHTDDVGALEYNQSLSERRAQAVLAYLKEKHGIASHRLLTRGYGETQPIAANATEHGRSQNRRVEFIRLE